MRDKTLPPKAVNCVLFIECFPTKWTDIIFQGTVGLYTKGAERKYATPRGIRIRLWNGTTG